MSKNTFITTKLLAFAALTSWSVTQTANANECGVTSSSSELVSYEFNDIDLSSVLMLASHAAGKEVTGMELLQDKKVSAAAKEVNVTAFVDALLLVNGFNFTEQDNNWIITEM